MMANRSRIAVAAVVRWKRRSGLGAATWCGGRARGHHGGEGLNSGDACSLDGDVDAVWFCLSREKSMGGFCDLIAVALVGLRFVMVIWVYTSWELGKSTVWNGGRGGSGEVWLRGPRADLVWGNGEGINGRELLTVLVCCVWDLGLRWWSVMAVHGIL
ncbi:hypothetical protein M0R45_019603 [Rubus argutus]|uniref:Uncharacterized protein n=1 Tax=Rubus argutus TaxID=59490 RepID=A0AAW1X5U1_RUBAR